MLSINWVKSNRIVILALLLFVTGCTEFSTTSAPPMPPTRVAPQSPHTTARLRRFDPAAHLRFERISVEQGLSQSSVRCITQDRRGFLWFGTEDGLNRYDGYGFQVYKHDPDDPASIASNAISALYEDSLGALWIGTETDGLDRLDREREQFVHYRHSPIYSAGLSHDNIRVLYEDTHGVLWIGTEGGLSRVDLKRQQWDNFRAVANAPEAIQRGIIFAIFESPTGALWFGTNGGLMRYDRDTQTFIAYRNKLEDPTSLSYNGVAAIAEDTHGALWVGTWGGGINLLDADGKQFTRLLSKRDEPAMLSSNMIIAIHADRSGALWIATADRGINRYDPERRQFTRYARAADDVTSLSNNNIRSIYEDKTGILWIGTMGGGVNKLDLAHQQFTHYRSLFGERNTLSSSMVLAVLAESKEIVWIGAEDGLNRLDRATGKFTQYKNDPDDVNSLGHNSVRAIYKDRAGTLWVGTDGGGLQRFDPARNNFVRYIRDANDPASLSSNVVLTFYEDESGALWVGTAFGLDRFDRATGKFTHYRSQSDDPTTLSNNYVIAIYPDRFGLLWVATPGGLNKFDPGTGKFTRYLNDPNDASSLSGNFVLSIHQDRAGNLWVGTYTDGLNKLDPATGKFTHYREKQGLPNDTVYAILEDDDGFLWLSTNKGIAKFDARTERFKHYDVNDGLQSNEFNWGAYHQSADGEMFFGGINGLTAFYPSDIQDDATAAPVALTQLTQAGEALRLNQSIESTRAITLAWPQNYFEFEFTALDFSQAHKNQYAYLLEGFDRRWNEVGNKHAGRYTNLPGGTYTLRVIASNGDGAWSAPGAALQVTVVPPIWDAWWMRGVLGVLLAAGAWAGYRLRVGDIRARNRALAKRLDESTWALQQQTHELERQQQELHALFAAEQRRAEQFQIITEIGRNVTALLETRQIMEQVTQSLQKAFNYYHVGIGLIEGDEVVYRVGAGTLWDDPDFTFKPQRLRVGKEGLTGTVAARGEPLIVPDVSQDARYVLMQGSATRAELLVPIIVKEQVIGVLDVQSDRANAFDETDLAVMQSIANQTGAAIENARLYERAQELAVMQERNRLARDLHDAVTQTLFSASLLADALPASWENDPAEGRQLLKELRQLSRGALAEMRTLLLELRPAALVETMLGNLLRQLSEAAAGRTGLRVTTRIDGDCKLPAEAHIAFYRIAQEALNNVLKHSRATNVLVELHCRADDAGRIVQLAVSDDGRGFDLTHIPSDHFGLRNMRERAQAIGAELGVTSAPSRGTRIELVWKNQEAR